jgi:hypothetical protein
MYGEGYPLWGKINILAKFSLNSSNKLNYKETSPEFIVGEINNNKIEDKERTEEEEDDDHEEEK